MSTRENTTSVSYRRNRDYSKHFVWTYELNADLYKCYCKAKEDPRIGYMARMKEHWDTLHPELSHFSSKQLRQQATNIEKQGGILDTVLPEISNNPVEIRPENIDVHVATPIILPVVEDGDSYNEEIIDQELLKKITDVFTKYFYMFEKTSLQERTYNIPVYENIDKHEWNVMNHVISTFLHSHEAVDMWTINVVHYAAAITMLEIRDKLPTQTKRSNKKSNWISSYEERINSIRRKISHVQVILNCRKNNLTLTSHQKTVQNKLRKMFGNTKSCTLTGKLSILKHELKVACEYLKRRKTIIERNNINNRFKYNQKKIFRDWKSKAIKVENPPSKEEITEFWANIWHKETNYNRDAKWLKNLEKNYCNNATQCDYAIREKQFNDVIKNMKNRGAPGPDRIQGFWIKKLSSTHKFMIFEYSKHFEEQISLREWLTASRTILTAKNTETKFAKNYRPIACQNVMYKIYTGILYRFLQDHVTTNDIIELEQAGGRARSWGCADQLIINKMILDEVKTYRRNILMMWFDYQKAFDSVPHDWIVKSLELAKVPPKVIEAVKQLMSAWATKVTLHTESEEIETDVIKYKTGLLQGDSLSLLIFTLCINPLSFLLRKLPGYKVGRSNKREAEINHLFFVDDLKTFANNLKEGSIQLDLISKFSNDIQMKFGESKCAYLYVERGQRKSLGESMEMNELTLNEIPEGDHYKYLGQEESVGIDGALNKERVTSEYYKRIRKIWNSELYANNKITAHNIFANPVLTPTFGILNWTKEELEAIDIKTRKILSLSGSFHVNSDVDRLYCTRNVGGRGLNSIVDIFITRIISFVQHLKEVSDVNPYLKMVQEHEEDGIFRVSGELKTSLKVPESDEETPKSLSANTKKRLKDLHEECWLKKEQHGYLFSKRKNLGDIDTKLTNAWHTNSTFSSHVEGFLCAIQEEEINTNHLKHKRSTNSQDVNPKCRLCHGKDETIHHIVASCPMLSASMYLPVRHDEVAKEVYRKLISPNENAKIPILEAYSTDDTDIWWDNKIKMPSNVKHHKPDIVLWRKNEKKCFIIDVVVGLDVNVNTNCQLKHDHYFQLCAELKRMYDDYSFEIIPISLGATGLITKTLAPNLEKIGIEDISKTIKRMQQKALLGTMKIVKSFMKS